MPILKEKHEKVVQIYMLNGFNKMAAYIEAGFSKKGACGAASKFFERPYVKARIEELQEELTREANERFKVNAERIIGEWAHIAFARADELYDENGALKSPDSWGSDLSAVISKVKVREIVEFDNGKKIKVGEVTELTLHSKIEALKSLSQIEGLYVKDNQQRNPYAEIPDEELERRIKAKEKVLKNRNVH